MPQSADQNWGVSEKAAALHRSALVWDDHCGFAYAKGPILEGLERWRSSGVSYLSVNIGYDVTPWTLTVEAASQYRHWIADHPDTLVQVEKAADIRRAQKEGRLAIAFDIEGMDSLNGDVTMVELYYRLGARQMLFAYNRNNLAGGGCHDEDVGLSDFGRAVVGEMNRVGMVVDCSHSAYRTTMEAMELSQSPVIFSHSNSRKLWDHERNIRDDQIKACAATGGVIGVAGVGRFLGPNGPTIEHLVEHIDYMVNLVGPKHVGFGMDSVLHKHRPNQPFSRSRTYWPERQYPDSGTGYVSPEETPRLTQALLDRGYDEDSIRGILGENFLRIAETVWK